MSSAEERMINAKEMYDVVASDNEKLRGIIEELKGMPDRMEPLSNYYFNEWMEDMTELDEKNFHNEVMDQDSIYEEIADQYEMMKEIILIAAKYINKDFN